MPSVLIQCDGAPAPAVPKRRRWDIKRAVNCVGEHRDLLVNFENTSHKLLTSVKGRAADLIHIAAHAYAADQSVSRGGVGSAYNEGWQRQITVAVPVNDPAFWNKPEVLQALAILLHFLSDDTWEFVFSQAPPAGARQLLISEAGIGAAELFLGKPDLVVLFSGGADSLSATVEAVATGRKPILLSHKSATQVTRQQLDLMALLRPELKRCGWDPPHVDATIHRLGIEPADVSQRTRSFLFAALGSAFAFELGVRTVWLADNGVVSINAPINWQLTDSHASRTTHPKFFQYANALIGAVTEGRVRIENPLAGRTRSEALGVLKSAGLSKLLAKTVSCSTVRGRRKEAPHCGMCFQCIDRRFGVAAANAEGDDPLSGYQIDIFLNPITKPDGKTLAQCYVRFAALIDKLADEALLSEFPQLYDCITPGTSDPLAPLQTAIAVLKRHARATLDVLGRRIGMHVDAVVDGSLPVDCLLSMVARGEHYNDERLTVVNEITDNLRSALSVWYGGGGGKDKGPRLPAGEAEVQRYADSLWTTGRFGLNRETPVLPFAGIGTKADFSKRASAGWLFVEMKFPATRERVNHIITEITSRQSIYRKQGAQSLFLVYDPARSIPNPDTFVSDLDGEDASWVRVIR